MSVVRRCASRPILPTRHAAAVFPKPTHGVKMRKLKLDVDALKVEEFATEGTGANKIGTVRGHDSYTNCFCPHTYLDLGCQTVSEDDLCVCEVHTKLNEYTCYPGCI
jgi:hypothetical protein